MREERKGGEEGGEEGRKQGWQGRRGARTSAPRPAPPGEKSATRAPPASPGCYDPQTAIVAPSALYAALREFRDWLSLIAAR